MKHTIKSSTVENLFYDVYESRSDYAKTLYLIGSYGGKLAYFRIFVRKMIHHGYRVVYFQPTKDVLSIANPEWLGTAIDQVSEYIKKDIQRRSDKSSMLAGVSLGSYIGLNVLQSIKFNKFVVVAGGAPLRGVFRSSFMFRSARTKLRKQKSGFEKVDQHWESYDTAFENLNLKTTSILLLNSKSDGVIKHAELTIFLSKLSKTGANIENRLNERSSHIVQALSINWRGKEVRAFLESE